MLSYNKVKFLQLRRVLRWNSLLKSVRYTPITVQCVNSLFTSRCMESTTAHATRASLIRLIEPRTLSHEGLAYANCPVCKKSCHMCDMLTHLTVTHKELDVNECAEVCRARLELYEKVMGIPLIKPTLIKSEKKELELYLPTITKEGYMCNWCVRRSEVHSTRDAFLKHVACTHVEVDLDEIEPLVGFLTDRHVNCTTVEQKESKNLVPNEKSQMEHSSHSAEQVSVNNTNNDDNTIVRETLDEDKQHIVSSSRNQSGEMNYPEKMPSSSSSLESSRVGQDSHTHTLSDSFASLARVDVKPTRRMQNVKIILEHIPSNDAMLIGRFTKKKISIPRHVYSDNSNIAASGKNDVNVKERNHVFEERRHGNVIVQREGSVSMVPNSSVSEEMAMEFAPNNFHCELCRKVFTNEHNLLQHLESRHPTGTLESNLTAKSVKGKSRSSVAVTAQRVKHDDDKETKKQLQERCYKCDLCTSTKTFNTTSSLYAHIRFKHPHADTEFEVARLVESQKTAQRFVCEYCLRAYNSQEALQDHLTDKHPDKLSKSNGAHSDARSDAKIPSLPQINARRRWWCTICEKGFSSPESIRLHKTQKHNFPLEQYPCPACKRVYMDVYTLERHLIQTHKSINCRELGLTNHAECKKCGRLFIDFDDLHQHEVKHHNKDPCLPARKLQSNITSSQEITMTTHSVNANGNTQSLPNSSKTANEDNISSNDNNNSHNVSSSNNNNSINNQSTEPSKKVVKLSELLEKRGPRKVAARRAKARAAAE